MPQQLPDEILYDSRLVDRHIARGLLTREQVDKRRAELVDMADQGEVLDLDQLAASARGTGAKRPA